MIHGWVCEHRADRINHEEREDTKTNSAYLDSSEGNHGNSILLFLRQRVEPEFVRAADRRVFVSS
jgi:hypothetical protein